MNTTATALENMLPKLAKLRSHNSKLLEALKRYGRHGSDDAGNLCEHAKHSNHRCTCGLDAALKQARGDV
jgi:hypothetical protein